MSSYTCEMLYCGKADPTLTRIVKVASSCALSAADVAGPTVVLCDADADITLTMPDTGEDEVRGVSVVATGRGKVTVRAADKGKVAGRDSIEIKSGEMLAGSTPAPQPLEK